jgi:hypothetical protein
MSAIRKLNPKLHILEINGRSAVMWYMKCDVVKTSQSYTPYGQHQSPRERLVKGDLKVSCRVPNDPISLDAHPDSMSKGMKTFPKGSFDLRTDSSGTRKVSVWPVVLRQIATLQTAPLLIKTPRTGLSPAMRFQWVRLPQECCLPQARTWGPTKSGSARFLRPGSLSVDCLGSEILERRAFS